MSLRSLPTAVTVAGLVLSLGACAPSAELQPAPGSNVAPGPGEGVQSTKEGVQVAMFVDAWGARPADLGSVLTPVLVRINNHGTVPVAVQYGSFELMGAPGSPLRPIPPYSIDKTVSEPVNTAAYPVTGFEIAPYLSPYYPDFTPYAGDFLMDPDIYGVTFPAFRNVELPTRQMVRFALPEGVVDPGGEATGFLYFPRLGDFAGRVSFQMDLVNARTGSQLGTIRLPFVAKK